jgi:hypothetical protein
MQEIIRSHLTEIEAEEMVRIVYACESGSRAWGFPSIDSDYDVRFLYVRPLAWYLSIDAKRAVIERPIRDSLDISGWDLKKALHLFRKSNAPLLEWLSSPIVYRDAYRVLARMRDLAPLCYSPTACLHYYLHMLRRHFQEYLLGEQVRGKKLFYVLRPLLAMDWIALGLGVVPMQFSVLLKRLVTDPELRQAIDRLVAAKRAGTESDRLPRLEPVTAFIERSLARWEAQPIPPHFRSVPGDELDALFRACLAEAWQSQGHATVHARSLSEEGMAR